MPPGGNLDEMLKEHEKQIQQAVRKARVEKSGQQQRYRGRDARQLKERESESERRKIKTTQQHVFEVYIKAIETHQAFCLGF